MYRTIQVVGFIGLVLCLAHSAVMAAECQATKWITYAGTQLWRMPDSDAYFYVVDRMAVDADGAPNAYHPNDIGIDALANAGFPHQGWRSVLVVDPSAANRPYIQKDGEFAGYFVAKTSLQDSCLPVTDVRRYVDARRVPYAVFPGAFYAMKGTGKFGDLGMALNLANGKESPVIVADAGPPNDPLGEVSIRLAENLGGVNVNPRNGAGIPSGRFVYLIVPSSGWKPPCPVVREDLQWRAQALLARLGGWDSVRACLGNP